MHSSAIGWIAFRFQSLKSWISVLGFIFLLLNGCKTQSFGTTYTASSSGNWENSVTWSIGRGPDNNDTITIPSGKTVVVTTITAEYSSMLVIVYGTMHFNGGKKLRMCDGEVDVAAGGKIEADNAGSKIDICSNMVWDGNDNGTGPLVIRNALPVSLTAIDAKALSDAITIEWTTTSEIDCDHFTLERSREGDVFSEIGEIKGAGSSTSTHHYSFTDFNPYHGLSYYRLLQTNYDGSTEVLKTLTVKTSRDELKLYPNPVARRDNHTIQIDVPDDSAIRISISDYSGKEIFNQEFYGNEEKRMLPARMKECLTQPGIYSVRITISDSVYYKKLAVVD